jgi:hypothetical protein
MLCICKQEVLKATDYEDDCLLGFSPVQSAEVGRHFRGSNCKFPTFVPSSGILSETRPRIFISVWFRKICCSLWYAWSVVVTL